MNRAILKNFARKLRMPLLVFGVFNTFIFGGLYMQLPQADKTEPMNKDEKTFLKSLFGDKIDTTGLEKRYCVPKDPNLLSFVRPFDKKDVSISSEATYAADYSQTDAFRKGVFAHEGEHLVEHQRGLLSCYFTAMSKLFNGSYTYELTPGKPLKKYGTEQRGEIVRGYVDRFITPVYPVPPQTAQDSVLAQTMENEYPASRATRLGLK